MRDHVTSCTLYLDPCVACLMIDYFVSFYILWFKYSNLCVCPSWEEPALSLPHSWCFCARCRFWPWSLQSLSSSHPPHCVWSHAVAFWDLQIHTNPLKRKFINSNNRVKCYHFVKEILSSESRVSPIGSTRPWFSPLKSLYFLLIQISIISSKNLTL